MNKIILCLTLISLSSCASMEFLTKDPDVVKAEKAKAAFVAEAKTLGANEFYGDAYKALEGSTKGQAAEYLFSLSNNGALPPDQALYSLHTVNHSIGERLLEGATKVCATDKLACKDADRISKSLDSFRKCEAGDGQACALKALDLEPMFQADALAYAKKACVLGNRGGCEMVSQFHQSQEAQRDRAVAYDQMEQQRRRDVANSISESLRRSQGTTCTTSRGAFGSVETHCR
jgi:hypothetical protein